MIRLLAKLRRMNLKNRNFLRYAQYAVGEIILIIIGIMIALYLDDMSRDRDRQRAFDTALSQVYTNLQMEKGWYQFFQASYENQSRIARQYLDGQYQVPEGKEPKIVGFMNSLALGDLNLADEAILSALHDNITSSEQTVLVNKISSHYLVWKDWDNVINGYKIRFLDDLFKKYKCPFIENYVLFDEGQFGGTREYSALEIEKARQIQSDEYFEAAVISVLNRNKDLLGRYDWKIRSIESIIEVIRGYNPSIPLTFEELGVNFIASEGGSPVFLPMELSDPVKAIWQARLPLDGGHILFRNGNSALVGWGTTLAADGTLLYNGKDIPVQAGTYDIEINLTDLTYSLTGVADSGDD